MRGHRRTIGAAALLLAASVSLGAAEPPQAQPQTSAAQPIPRTAWGDPDITGIWNFVVDATVNPGGGSEDLVHGELPLDIKQLTEQGVPAGRFKWPGSMVRGTADGEVPYQPWALAKRKERERKFLNPPSVDLVPSGARCLLYGMPHTMLRANPHVYQFKDHILMQWEYPQMDRIIWTDGRPPLDPAIRLWEGFSVGHWDGDTLTVTTANQNGFPWLDQTGDVMGQDTRTTETIRVLGPNSLAYKVVVQDPSIYTQSWWMEWHYMIRKPGAAPPGAAAGQLGKGGLPTDFNALMANDEILEVACVEGNRQYALESVVPPKGGKE